MPQNRMEPSKPRILTESVKLWRVFSSLPEWCWESVADLRLTAIYVKLTGLQIECMITGSKERKESVLFNTILSI